MKNDKALARMFLELSDDMDKLIQEIGLNIDTIAMIQEGDTTDLATIALLCDSLDLEFRLYPGFKAYFVLR